MLTIEKKILHQLSSDSDLASEGTASRILVYLDEGWSRIYLYMNADE